MVLTALRRPVALTRTLQSMNCWKAMSTSSKKFVSRLHRELDKLDDYVEEQRVRTAAPDWLPFRPGSSYWIPDAVSRHYQRSRSRPPPPEEEEEEEESSSSADEDDDNAQVVCHVILVDTSSPSDSES